MSLFASSRGIRLPRPEPPARSVLDIPPPKTVVLPMRQTIGPPARPLVQAGDEVLKGQRIGEPEDLAGVPILATTSGKVLAVEDRPGPEGVAELSVVIESDGEDRWEREPGTEAGALDLSPDEMLDRIRAAGVINSGFGAEPAHRDLGTAIRTRGYVGVSGTPVLRSVEHLIVRAADVDPEAHALEAILLHDLEGAQQGFEVLKRLLGSTAIHLVLTQGQGRGIEEQEIEKLCEPLEIWPVPARPWAYPTLSDPLLIRSTTGIEVGGAFREARDTGVLVANIDTVVDVGRAVTAQQPQLSRVLWVAGMVGKPQLVRVRFGTLVRDVLEACGGTVGVPGAVLFGGPMRGRAQHDLDAPVTRMSGMLYVLGQDEIVDFTNEPCMNCGACPRVCPMRLQPHVLSRLCEYGEFEDALGQDLLTCIECGCCTYVCPSRRANVHYLLHGKSEVMARRLRT